MRAGVLALVTVAGVLMLGALPAHASDPPSGWDGTNPFSCTLQQAGLGATVPDPDADPYCVDFDKRHQNVTELGVVDFLANEPARVAAAVPKCFYFQSDHWRGSVVDSDGSTKTYEWDGHYFFDKAHGEGGVWVTNFNINGHTGDPSGIPGVPQDWARYFGPGTGGVITHNQIQADPNCVARAGQGPAVYSQAPKREFLPPASAPPAACAPASATIAAGRLGAARIGDADEALREALGDPVREAGPLLRFCASGGGRLAALQRGGRTALIYATGPGFRTSRGVGRGASVRKLRRAKAVTRTGATRVRSAGGVLFGVRGRRVRFVAVYDRGAYRTPGAIARALKRVRSA